MVKSKSTKPMATPKSEPGVRAETQETAHTVLHTAPSVKKLTRSKSDQMIAGVAAGIANYLSIDPIIVRLIFVLITLGGGSGILLYVLLWIIMPLEEDSDKTSNEVIKENTRDMKEKAEHFASEVSSYAKQGGNGQLWAGIILLLVGLYFLAGNLGFFDVFRFLRPELLWPLVLIAVGIILLSRKNEK